MKTFKRLYAFTFICIVVYTCCANKTPDSKENTTINKTKLTKEKSRVNAVYEES